MIEVEDALAAPRGHEPSSAGFSHRATEKETEEVLGLVENVLPRKESAPAHDEMKVEGVRSDRVQAPPAMFADVGASQDQHLLNVAIEGGFGSFGGPVVLLGAFGIG